MIKLRPYQKAAIAAIKDTFTKDFRQYIELPTGSGKTVTFLSYAKENHSRILVIVPSIELMNQVYSSALLFYHKSEISRKGGSYYEFFNKIHICVVHSIRDKYLEDIAQFPFDLIIIDEAHHSASPSYRRFIKRKSEYFKEKDMLILGVTATPDRLDGQFLKDILYSCSYQITTPELIEQGYLSDIEGYAIKTNIDLSDIEDHNADFNNGHLYKRLGTESRNKLILDAYKKEMFDRKLLIFCINVAHSKEITKVFQENGIAAEHIDGKKTPEERTAILSSFRKGEISVLCNCQLLTEGFDEPSIDGIILARPTKSRSFYIQMIGRGLRLSPGKKNCKIIDIVDAHKSACRFSCLASDEGLNSPEKFSSVKDLQEAMTYERMELMECTIERVNLLDSFKNYDPEAMRCQERDLELLNIPFFRPITMNEASFLLWLDKLKKEMTHGKHSI